MELGSSPADLEVDVATPAAEPLRGWLTSLNSVLSRLTMYVACLCLAGLLSVVVYGVVLRYVFNNAPPYVEQVALLLVISVAMFGASAGVRDAGPAGRPVGSPQPAVRHAGGEEKDLVARAGEPDGAEAVGGLT